MPTNPISLPDLEVPPKVILALDPGKSTGWALWVYKEKDVYIPHDFGTFRGLDALEEGLIEFKYTPDLVIYEDFRLFKWKAMQQSGSDMPASLAIGSITFWARSKRIPVVKQSPQILPIAQKWSKMPMPKNHDASHHISAMNHAVYYLVSNNLMNPIGM